MTKSVKFDENGRRSEIEIQLFDLNSQGSSLIGTWSPDEGIKQVLGASTMPIEGDAVVNSLKNRTFIVLTALVNMHLFNFFFSFFSTFDHSHLISFPICSLPDGSIRNVKRSIVATHWKRSIRRLWH